MEAAQSMGPTGATVPLTVVSSPEGLVIGGVAERDGKWRAQVLDETRILLTELDGRASASNTSPDGIAFTPIELFRSFLVALHTGGFSGTVVADTGFGVKRLFFRRGELVFASSSIMDDRLGEVIYREAKITLDELTDSTSQVTKSRKFGQVLLASGTFSHVQLWRALQLQVRQILRSLFMVDRVFLELQSVEGAVAMELVFAEGTQGLIQDAAAYGCAFRVFLGKLREESEVKLLIDPAHRHGPLASGTFAGDLLALIEQSPSVQNLLNSSKLIDTYTVAALFHLVGQGLCQVVPEVADEVRTTAMLAPVKAKIDAYGYLLGGVRQAFKDGQREFPLRDLREFAAGLCVDGFPSLYLDAQGNLARECLSGIISQCRTEASRMSYYVGRLESLAQFLLQVLGDTVDFSTAQALRRDYMSVTA